jgi:hypothetical protein
MDISDVFEHYTVADNGCWNWTLGKSKGYGAINYMGRVWAAHRVAYELAKGPIPAGLSVCHSCDNPACINPNHLFVGTHRDNMLDKERKGRANHVGARGVRNANSILTEKDVIAMRQAYVRGVRAADIAARFGMARSAVNDVVNGRSWQHLLGSHGCPTLEELKAAAAINTRNNTGSPEGRKMRSDNSSGVQGISWDKSRGKYQVRVTVDGKAKNLGRFETIEAATAARAVYLASL